MALTLLLPTNEIVEQELRPLPPGLQSSDSILGALRHKGMVLNL